MAAQAFFFAGLTVRCECGRDAQFDEVVPPGGRAVPGETLEETRCGSCYVRLFTEDEAAALAQVRPVHRIDGGLSGEGLDALAATLQLLGVRRLRWREPPPPG